MSDLNFASRDNGRTPMQWDTSKNAHFTSGEPWLPVNENHKSINVFTENSNPNSILNHFKKMVKLRKEHEVLIYGDYQLLAVENPDIYAYTRTLNHEKLLVLLNFTNHDSSIELTEAKTLQTTLINNYGDLINNNGNILLKPYQAVICKIN